MQESISLFPLHVDCHQLPCQQEHVEELYASKRFAPACSAKCSHPQFSLEELQHTASVYFSAGRIWLKRKHLWCIGTADAFSVRSIRDVEKRVRQVCFEDEPISPNFRRKLRGALLQAIHFPLTSGAPTGSGKWVQRLLDLAPSVRFGTFRFNPRAQASDLISIPENKIPQGLGRHWRVCASELCYLAQIARENLPLTPMTRLRMRRVDAVAGYLYSTVDTMLSREPLVRAWIDSRVEDVLNSPRVAQVWDDRVEEPLVILFQGPAGAGKTTRIAQICEHLGLPQHEVYYRPEAKHWDGYSGQLVTVFDDLFQGASREKLSEFIQVVNSVSIPLPMASLAQKGTYFTSPIVIVTANDLTVPGAVSAEAVARRFKHVICCRAGKMRVGSLSVKKKIQVSSEGRNLSLSQVCRPLEALLFGEELSDLYGPGLADHELGDSGDIQSNEESPLLEMPALQASTICDVSEEPSVPQDASSLEVVEDMGSWDDHDELVQFSLEYERAYRDLFGELGSFVRALNLGERQKLTTSQRLKINDELWSAYVEDRISSRPLKAVVYDLVAKSRRIPSRYEGYHMLDLVLLSSSEKQEWKLLKRLSLSQVYRLVTQ